MIVVYILRVYSPDLFMFPNNFNLAAVFNVKKIRMNYLTDSHLFIIKY